MTETPASHLADPGFLVALGAALVVTPLVRALALRIGFVDAPRGDRHHTTPTPYLGGLAVFLALVAGLFASGRVDLDTGRQSLETARPYTVLLFVTATSFLLGLVDDWKRLAPPAKLAGQVLICSIFMAAAGGGPFASPGLDGAVGVFWIVGLMNAFNFLDNMDGILAGVSLCVIAGFAGIAVAAGGPDAAAAGLPGGGAASPDATAAGAGGAIPHAARDVVAWLLPAAGALAGYLAFNFPPARIFLGDAGSLMLGGALSAAGWSLAAQAAGIAAGSGSAGGAPSGFGAPGGAATAVSADPGAVWIALPLCMAYPIFDITFVTVTRLKRGQPPWVGGRDHTTHRLATRLCSVRRATIAVYALALLGALAAWIAAGSALPMAWGVLGVAGAAFAGLGVWLAKVRVA